MFKLFAFTLWLMMISANCFAQQDPTRPLVARAGINAEQNKNNHRELVLQSIINASNKNKIKAIISGKTVRVGDRIKHYQIVDISDHSVTLQSAERIKKLVLFAKQIVNYK